MPDSWEEILLKSGFEKYPCDYKLGDLWSPFFNKKFRPISDTSSSVCFKLFRQGSFLICIRPLKTAYLNHDRLLILHKNNLLVDETVNGNSASHDGYASNQDIVMLLQAFSDRSVLPLLLDIPWAEQVVKILMQGRPY
jgi:hypothetical protein